VFLALILAIATLLIGVFFHLGNITLFADKLIATKASRYLTTPIVVGVAVLSQILIAGVFTCTYLLGQKLELGDFVQSTTLSDIFYFSLTTITTLGLGSIEPTEHLRMVAGIESATGFLLISCSAQKVYTTMQRNV